MRTRWLLAALPLAVLLPSAPVAAEARAPAAVPAARIVGRVVGVHDGDTITVYSGGGPQIKVRLDGIDAPESKQAFGGAAKRRLSDLVFGKAVTVETKGTDRYRRTIGIVRAGGVNVNLLMVRAGLAWHYKKYSRDPALAAAENAARRAKGGLWAEPNPVPPWEFRKKPK